MENEVIVIIYDASLSRLHTFARTMESVFERLCLGWKWMDNLGAVGSDTQRVPVSVSVVVVSPPAVVVVPQNYYSSSSYHPSPSRFSSNFRSFGVHGSSYCGRVGAVVVIAVVAVAVCFCSCFWNYLFLFLLLLLCD